MARRKKKGGGGGGADWMGTYGDMVTLLLCFFVLLFSMSTIDSAKWEIIVKSFNPEAEEISQIVENTEPTEQENNTVDGSPDPPEIIEDFEDLYYYLKNYVEQENLQDDMAVTKGEGFTFITFSNNVFFDGESYIIKPDGKNILDDIGKAIEPVAEQIKEIQVLGHTSQAEPNVPNDVDVDRFLSSNRATEVAVFLQTKEIIDPKKIVSIGYGQFRPVSSFETKESRAKNRRVEILITKDDGTIKSIEDYYEEAYGIVDGVFSDGTTTPEDGTTTPEDGTTTPEDGTTTPENSVIAPLENGVISLPKENIQDTENIQNTEDIQDTEDIQNTEDIGAN